MKNKKMLAMVLLSFVSAPNVIAEKLNVDTKESSVKWLGKKVTGEHYGSIAVKEGTLKVSDGEIKGGKIFIDMQSIENKDLTDAEYNQKLVGHLKSEDFFSVEKFPTAELVLTDVENRGDGYDFTGDLTIKGITHPVQFSGTSTTEKDGIKVEGSLTVNRSKYNVRYGSKSFFANLGDKVIYDDFKLDFVLVAKK
ncbi:MAG TPA: YceI family protein [Sunxiuqinia sp.]|nr:YceI family protein [Sunxiuqinia sp.]